AFDTSYPQAEAQAAWPTSLWSLREGTLRRDGLEKPRPGPATLTADPHGVQVGERQSEGAREYLFGLVRKGELSVCGGRWSFSSVRQPLVRVRRRELAMGARPHRFGANCLTL